MPHILSVIGNTDVLKFVNLSSTTPNYICSPINVAPPCGQQKDCSNLANGRYADKDNNCSSYYTCNTGTFFGHSLCAGSLVFDEAKQTCNWPNNVLPPCGTNGTSSP
ncbi:uncharacterized protein LOC110444419 [Mizuhopecten yessoensis]|uniref:uncharacterized protein LOC110444419 n=1 Tax=Mizuhopecten yessoensis TaxID=6573 RepID=UPI000B459EB0|nr:uncharacterized protein LOC110444419 [Mizuhopecten yessoensis]